MKKFKQIICNLLILGNFLIALPSASSAITLTEEEELGKEFIKYVEKNFELIKDPVICDYINTVGDRILSKFPPQPFPYRFYIVKADVYNAFAGPAGHIVINSGLVDAMETEAELAGIISHEISHVVCRHISQQIERSSKINLATLAGVVAGIFLGMGGAGAAANAVTVGSIAAGQSVMLSYSRDHEMQADQIGLKYLNAAGYSGEGLLSILKKIRSKQWFGPEQIPTYLTTHPAVEDRIAYISSMIDRTPETKSGSSETKSFSLVHSRLSALYGDPQRMLAVFEDASHRHPDDPAVQYGYALILARTGTRDAASEYLKKALKQNPFDALMLSDLGRIYYLNGNYSDALSILTGALGIAPYHPIGLLYMGRTYLELEQYSAAASALEKLISTKPLEEDAYYFAGEAFGKQGIMGDAHFYLGVFYHKKRDFKNAAFHLQRALTEGIADPDREKEILQLLKENRNCELEENKELKK